MNIGVTGTGSLIGQALIKSLRHCRYKDNFRLIGFDYFPDTVGSYWVDCSLIRPDCLKISKEVWVEKVIEDLIEEKVDFLFIGLDFELILFSKWKDYIEQETKCQIVVSCPKVIEIANDKYATAEFLKNNGLAFPKTFLPEQLPEVQLEFPCIVKPRFGFRSRDVYVIKNSEDLTTTLSRVPRPIIQEYIGDPAYEYTCGVIFLEDQVKEMIILKRKLKDGNTIFAEYAGDSEEAIGEYIEKISGVLKPWGACNYQLRLDHNSQPKLFEINARHSGTTYIRSLFGFNEVEYLLAYFLGEKIEKFHLKKGSVHRYFEEMFVARP